MWVEFLEEKLLRDRDEWQVLTIHTRLLACETQMPPTSSYRWHPLPQGSTVTSNDLPHANIHKV